jgi:hypothetical protein
MSAWMAATSGVIGPKPLYVALLVYVAVVRNPGYGALGLGVHGLGLAASVALGGLILLPTSRSACLSRWLGARQEAFHVVQSVVFAAAGAVAIGFFWVRYVVVPPDVTCVPAQWCDASHRLFGLRRHHNEDVLTMPGFDGRGSILSVALSTCPRR